MPPLFLSLSLWSLSRSKNCQSADVAGKSFTRFHQQCSLRTVLFLSAVLSYMEIISSWSFWSIKIIKKVDRKAKTGRWFSGASWEYSKLAVSSMVCDYVLNTNVVEKNCYLRGSPSTTVSESLTRDILCLAFVACHKLLTIWWALWKWTQDITKLTLHMRNLCQSSTGAS